MGFGLHVGWAIEGAIGSRFKIDASYLSPNVNMASRLEAATKQFGTTILVSGDFAQLLSSSVRRRLRQVDCVTVKVGLKHQAVSAAGAGQIDLLGRAQCDQTTMHSCKSRSLAAQPACNTLNKQEVCEPELSSPHCCLHGPCSPS